jgi:hypothetical protein
MVERVQTQGELLHRDEMLTGKEWERFVVVSIDCYMLPEHISLSYAVCTQCIRVLILPV